MQYVKINFGTQKFSWKLDQFAQWYFEGLTLIQKCKDGGSGSYMCPCNYLHFLSLQKRLFLKNSLHTQNLSCNIDFVLMYIAVRPLSIVKRLQSISHSDLWGAQLPPLNSCNWDFNAQRPGSSFEVPSAKISIGNFNLLLRVHKQLFPFDVDEPFKSWHCYSKRHHFKPFKKECLLLMCYHSAFLKMH